jgi:hypothetical protein
LVAALGDQALLDTVREIRLSDSEICPDACGGAAIFYVRDDEEVVTHYVGGTENSLFQSGKERTYNPRDTISSIIRDIVYPPILLQVRCNHVCSARFRRHIPT